MDWTSLLSRERLRRPDAGPEIGRSRFQQDLDRIVFSAAFRRLAHKTQVHPLSPNDHVHTRLTHSIEVACVGRSLGTIVGREIISNVTDPKITADTLGDVVQAACLAHDIGNPPFGHGGETAIQKWFARRLAPSCADFHLVGAQREDFLRFEGNAQGFRILTQMENHKQNGGLQLTYAVLGTFSKYPCSSLAQPDSCDNYPGAKKFGFFEAERTHFEEVATGLDLRKRKAGENCWCRHPLAFLVEAADDICYAIIDIEDGYELKYLTFEEARDVLQPIVGDNVGSLDSLEPSEKISKLRALAIDKLVRAVASVFVDNERGLLDGILSSELLSLSEFKSHVNDAKLLAKEKLYQSERKTKLELAGGEMLAGLLDIFSEVVPYLARVDYEWPRLTERSQYLARLMGITKRPVQDDYSALLCVTDFISGMTDRYAVDLYRTLKGISV